MNATPPRPAPAPLPSRNPGPSWGYQFLRLADRVLPEVVFRPLRALGTGIALAGMPCQRRHSRDYLRVLLPRPPTWRDVFRHFFAFEESLMLRLRLANGAAVPCDYAADATDFSRWIASGESMLLGTMHVGLSDMLGFQLGGLARGPVHIVRQRVGNSHDTEALAHRCGGAVRFIWVNDRTDLLFALKEAAQTGGVIALQCDRLEHSSRTEAFEFLGARRLFPFTIYHLALIFDRPVLLSVGVAGDGRRSRLHSSPVFRRQPGEARADALRRARDHFQDFLRLVESLLRADPYCWFNFLPLNPPAAGAPPAS